MMKSFFLPADLFFSPCDRNSGFQSSQQSGYYYYYYYYYLCATPFMRKIELFSYDERISHPCGHPSFGLWTLFVTEFQTLQRSILNLLLLPVMKLIRLIQLFLNHDSSQDCPPAVVQIKRND